MSAGRMVFYAVAAGGVLAYAGIGSLIARRLPKNAIGWLLCLVGLTVVASMFTEQYALMGPATDPGGLPEVRHIGALSGGLVVLAFSVADDRVGFDPAATRMGSGVQGIADRLAATGGTLQITSSPGHGTRLAGRVPALAR